MKIGNYYIKKSMKEYSNEDISVTDLQFDCFELNSSHSFTEPINFA